MRVSLLSDRPYREVLCEGTNGNGAGYFLMPYGLVPVGINEMLLQTYDGVIRTFPCVPPSWDKHTIRFHRLRAFGGFSVSAEREQGVTKHIILDSALEGACDVEVPEGWKELVIQSDDGAAAQVKVTLTTQSVRMGRKDREVRIAHFRAERGKRYTFLSRRVP